MEEMQTVRIAVDAMGGDNAPEQIVLGALKAADELSQVEIQLYGDETQINQHIDGELPTNLKIIHASEKINSEDEPVKAIRTKKQSSMVLAAKAVKMGEADAIVSAGNTGALLTAGTLVVGRMRGVERPGLMTNMPNLAKAGESWLLIDAGANADSKPTHLLQYSIMATAYAITVQNKTNPRVGLLNNGTEANKGSELSKAAYQLLAEEPTINFIGNVESRELLNDAADIVVTDGFTGNAVLKSIEGTASTVMKAVKSTIMDGGITTKIGGALIKGSLKSMLATMNYDEAGGAVLFGAKAPVIKTHGTAKADTMYYALAQTQTVVNSAIIPELSDRFEAEFAKKRAAESPI